MVVAAQQIDRKVDRRGRAEVPARHRREGRDDVCDDRLSAWCEKRADVRQSGVEGRKVVQRRGAEHEIEPAGDFQQVARAISHVRGRSASAGELDHLATKIDRQDTLIALSNHDGAPTGSARGRVARGVFARSSHSWGYANTAIKPEFATVPASAQMQDRAGGPGRVLLFAKSESGVGRRACGAFVNVRTKADVRADLELTARF